MKKEFKNAVFSINFILAVVITLIVFFLAFADEDYADFYKKYDVLYIFNISMQLSPLFVFIPFIASLPYAYRFIDEYNSNYFRFSLSRCGYRKYAVNKVLSVSLSAFLAVFSGIVLGVVLALCISKPIDINDIEYVQLYETLKNGRIYGTLLDVNIYLYILIYVFFISLFASMWPIFGMISSTYIKNRYVSVVMPFVIFFMHWQISGRIVNLIPQFSRFLVLSNVYYGAYGLFESPYISFFATLFLVLAWQFLLFIWFFLRIKKCS